MPPDDGWRSAPRAYRLAAPEVHVWRAALAQPAATLDVLARSLSADERARAERYRAEADRHRSVIARGLLRLLLGRCLGEPPESLAFQTGEFGKPALSADGSASGEDRPYFNVSHGGDWILIGLALGRPIGVDVERLRPDIEHEKIAVRFFSPEERRTLSGLPEQQRTAAFFDCWTRKEAYLKALGDGLTLPLDSFDVSLRPGDEPRLLATRHDREAAARWGMAALHPGVDHAGAVVAQGRDWRLSCFHWEPSGA